MMKPDKLEVGEIISVLYIGEISETWVRFENENYKKTIDAVTGCIII